MSHSVILKAKGLKTAPNQLSEAGTGAMIEAENVVIDQANVLTSRRGIYPIRDSSAPYAKLGLSASGESCTFYNDNLIIQTSNDLLALWNDTSGATYFRTGGSPNTAGAATTFTSPTGVRTHFAESNGNLYFTTSTGVRKIASTSSAARYAGYPASLGFTGRASASGTGWLQNSESVAYRVVFGYEDANNNLILNNPARTRIVVAAASSGGPFVVGLTIPIPATAAAGDIYQVYRSASAASGETPGDELGLIYQNTLTSSQITAGQITLTDTVDDAFIGTSLYTNASQDGNLEGNDTPPAAKDLVWFNDRMIYLNVTEPQRYYLQLLAMGTSGASLGLVPGDSVHVAGQDYLCVYYSGIAPNVPTSYANNTFFIDTGPTDIIAAIEYTALNLCKAINANPNNTTINAYYISQPDDLPGSILLEERTVGGSGFTVTAHCIQSGGKSAPFDQNLPRKIIFGNTDWINGASVYGIQRTAGTVTVTTNSPINTELAIGNSVTITGLTGDSDFDGTFTLTAVGTNTFQYADARANNSCYNSLKNGVAAKHLYRVTIAGVDITTPVSSAEENPNGIAVSRLQQPEAVPLTNRLKVSNKTEILRGKALRDRLFVFKEDGIWSMTGDGPSNYRIDLFDGTAELIAPESVVALGNRIFAFTNQGVVSISGDSGVQIISRDIETELLELLGTVGYSTMTSLAWGVGYETERKYILHVPTAAGATACSKAYVYNLFTNTWTTQDTSFSCGAVAPTADVLYYANSDVGAGISRERKGFNYTDFADDAYPIPTTPSGVVTSFTFSGTGIASVGDVFYDAGHISAFLIDTVVENGGNTTVSTSTGTNFLVSLGIAGTRILKAIPKSVIWTADTAGNPTALKHYSAAKVFLGNCARFQSLDVSFGNELVGDAGDVTLNAPENANYPVALPTYVPREAQRCSLLEVGITHATAWDDLEINGIALRVRPGSERFTR